MNKTITTLAALIAASSSLIAAPKAKDQSLGVRFFDSEGKKYDAADFTIPKGYNVNLELYQLRDAVSPTAQVTQVPTPATTPVAMTRTSKGYVSLSPMFQDQSLETTVVDAYGTPLKKGTTSHKQGVAVDLRTYFPASEKLGFEVGMNGYKVADKDAMDFLNGQLDFRLVGNYGNLSAGLGPLFGVNQGNIKTRTGSVTLSKQQAGLVGDVKMTFADLVRLNLEGKTYTGSKFLPDSDAVKGNAIDLALGLQLGNLSVEGNTGYQNLEDGVKVISEKHVGGKVMYKLFKGTNLVGSYVASFPHSGGNATERQDTYQVGLQFGDQRTR